MKKTGDQDRSKGHTWRK